MPGSMFCRTKNVRTVRPALTSSTTDSATSITTSRLRVRPPCAPAPVLRPARSASVTSAFDVCSAGTSPNTMPVSSDTASENSSTGMLIVDPRLVRHVELRHQPDDGANRAEREQHAEHAAGERQQDALGQELAQQPAAAGANRHPDRHLARARRAAGQLQVGDVGARDEQQERDRAEQQLQAGPHLAARDGDVEIVPQRGREALRGKRSPASPRARRVFRALSCSSATAFDTPGASRTIGLIHGTSVRVGDSGSQNPSLPYQPKRGGITPTIVCGRPFSRSVRPTADGTALEQPQPQPVAQHHDRFGLAVRPDVGRLDGPADHRRHAEKIERVAGQEDAVEALGRELAGHAARSRSTSPSRRRTPAPRPGTKLVERVAVSAAAVERADLRGPDLARPGVGIRRDEDAVDDAEDRRRRADAERQRQQRDQHERRAAPERSNRVAEILSRAVRASVAYTSP